MLWAYPWLCTRIAPDGFVDPTRCQGLDPDRPGARQVPLAMLSPSLIFLSLVLSLYLGSRISSSQPALQCSLTVGLGCPYQSDWVGCALTGGGGGGATHPCTLTPESLAPGELKEFPCGKFVTCVYVWAQVTVFLYLSELCVHKCEYVNMCMYARCEHVCRCVYVIMSICVHSCVDIYM